MTTMDDDALKRAVDSGIITAEQRNLMLQQEAPVSPVTPHRTADEKIRVVNSFNEVFLAVGAWLLLSALAGIRHVILGEQVPGYLLYAILAWVGAELFVSRKNAGLPAIVCILYAAYALMQACALLLSDGVSSFGELATLAMDKKAPAGDAEAASFTLSIALATGVITALMAGIRLRIPFLMLPAGIGFVCLTLGLTEASGADSPIWLVLSLSGLALLGVAVWLDMRDPLRERRTSDYAFWLYVIGAPIMIHPLFIRTFIELWKQPEMAVLAVVVLCMVSTAAGLLLNRRSLVLSTLLYLSISLGYVLSKSGVAGALVALLPMALIGAYVICLGSAWPKLRHAFMVRLTPQPWFRKLPPY